MTVEFVCEKCEKDVLFELGNSEPKSCPHCQKNYEINLSRSMQNGDKVDRCVVCDRIRFYVQKDFNPRLGLIIFGIGAALSYHTYGLTLLIATIIDFILYKVLKTVTVCYHCRAIYRDFEEDPAHRGFDHELAMSLFEQEKKESSQVEELGEST